jgi:cyclopropane-fatty-acyl-phospholipid synthase
VPVIWRLPIAARAADLRPGSEIAQLENTLRARCDPLPVSFVVRAGDEARVIGGDDPSFVLTIKNRAGWAAVLSLRELAVVEAYIRGDIDLEGDLSRAMSLRAALGDTEVGIKLWAFLEPILRGRTRCNPEWIAKHYDSNNIQLLAVDRQYNTYTPGIYESTNDSLEDGAARKFEAAFRSLCLERGMTLLDVGCGWGGFVRYCAERGVEVTGITLSRHQLHFLEERLRQEQLHASVSYTDFFSYHPGRRYDAISLMGVLEDLSDYHRVMTHVLDLVDQNGRIYADFAASPSPFGMCSFITKYVWPGRFRIVYLPGFMRAVGRNSLEIVEMHNDRRNYHLWATKVYDRWVARKSEVLAVADGETWRTFRLLYAGVARTMGDPTGRVTAYRVVLAPRQI